MVTETPQKSGKIIRDYFDLDELIKKEVEEAGLRIKKVATSFEDIERDVEDLTAPSTTKEVTKKPVDDDE
ncbi:hypothetical protein M0R04_07790 [Candidatus Dojkabacteria bacterium]|jgi:hypothetical protein|nr:hypothetical protein [Candidatus Dojkabacteria bacterium]